MLSPQVAGAMEPRVAGAAFEVWLRKSFSNPVGDRSLCLVKKSEGNGEQTTGRHQTGDSGTSRTKFTAIRAEFLEMLQDNAKIEDYRIEVYNQASQQN